MKFRFVFILILFLLLTISIFVGLPYIVQLVRSGSFSFSLPFPLPFSLPIGREALPIGNWVLPKITTNPISNYFFSPPVGNQALPSQIKIGNVYYSSGQQQISLMPPYYGDPVNITGWKIKSVRKGSEIIIGQGVNLPQVNATLFDIWLKNGDSVDIMVGKSPLAANFHINSCFGWLSGLYNLDYSVNYCSDGFNFNDLTGLDSACQDLILGAGACRAPSADVLNLNKNSYQCRQWVEKNMNYDACVSRRINDSSFYRGWKAYTGNSNLIFDQRHDRIELRDQNGVLIDQYEY